MNLVETVTNYQCQDDIEIYKKFYTKIYEHFKINKTINKNELISKLPKYLTKPNTTKYNIVKKWKTYVTEKEFINLLMSQTTGADYPSFYYSILKYDLKLDNNNMIIFTKEFPFNNRIKKEALFTWNILYNLKHHSIIGNFIDFINCGLQFKCETHMIEDKRKLKYDIAFTNLNIIVEIDENHNSTTTINNDLKKSLISEMNGYVLLRLDFQKIYCDKIGKREIKKGDNANEYILNSIYYKEFLEILYDNICCSLLGKNEDFNKKYILYLLELSINQRLVNLNNDVEYNLEKIENNNILIKKTNNKSLKIKYQDNKIRYQKILDNNHKAIIDTKNILNLIKDSSGKFIELFKIKDESYKNGGTLGTKNIKIDEIINLLNLDYGDIDFINFIGYSGIYTRIYDNVKDILLSWKDVSTIIIKYKDSDAILSNALLSYYFELEESYEFIRKMIIQFNNILVPTQYKYKYCIANEVDKKKQEFISKHKAIKNTCNDLRTELDILKSKYQSINESYIRLLSNERNHNINQYCKEYIYSKTLDEINSIKNDLSDRFKRQLNTKCHIINEYDDEDIKIEEDEMTIYNGDDDPTDEEMEKILREHGRIASIYVPGFFSTNKEDIHDFAGRQRVKDYFEKLDKKREKQKSKNVTNPIKKSKKFINPIEISSSEVLPTASVSASLDYEDEYKSYKNYKDFNYSDDDVVKTRNLDIDEIDI